MYENYISDRKIDHVTSAQTIFILIQFFWILFHFSKRQLSKLDSNSISDLRYISKYLHGNSESVCYYLRLKILRGSDLDFRLGYNSGGFGRFDNKFSLQVRGQEVGGLKHHLVPRISYIYPSSAQNLNYTYPTKI